MTFEELIKERDAFLELHPELKKLQKHIDQNMQFMTTIERNIYLAELISFNLTDISIECRLLLEELEE